MSQIITLLQEKNEHLERFHSLNSEELSMISDGKFDNLDNFYNSRDCILNMINHVDSRIQDINKGLLTPDELELREKKHVLKLLDEKNDLVQQILAQDLQILSAIEKEKSNIIKALKQTNVVKKVFSSYKSEDRNKSERFDESV